MLALGAGAKGSEPLCNRDVGAAMPGRGSEGGLDPDGDATALAVDVEDPDAEPGLPRAGDEAPPGRGSLVRGEATLAATPAGELAVTALIDGVACDGTAFDRTGEAAGGCSGLAAGAALLAASVARLLANISFEPVGMASMTCSSTFELPSNCNSLR